MDPIDDTLEQYRDYDEVAPRLNWRTSQSDWWKRIEVPNPIISIQSIQAVANNTITQTLTADDYEIINARQGIIALHENVVQLSSGGSLLPYYDSMSTDNIWRSALRLQKSPMIPGFWAVAYTTGPLMNGHVGHVPTSLQFYVWADACRYLWSLNSTVVSRGIANQSRSIDGITNSVSLTNSAMYDLNSAIELICKTHMETHPLTTIKQKVAGIRLRGM
jgi:hypothetical protein